MPKKKLNKAGRVEALQVNVDRLYKVFRGRKGVIVGLDVARGRTGVAINPLDGTEIALFSHQTRSKGFAKVIEIERWLKGILKPRAIKAAFIEDYAYNAKQGREAAGEVGGIVRRYLWLRGIPTVPVSPLTLKSFIGAGDKSMIVKEVFKQYGADANNDDEADAFVLAIIGEMMYNAIIEFKKVKSKDMSKCETHPNRFCTLPVKKAKTIKDIIVNKGEYAYGFAKENKEERKKANPHPRKRIKKRR